MIIRVQQCEAMKYCESFNDPAISWLLSRFFEFVIAALFITFALIFIVGALIIVSEWLNAPKDDQEDS